MHIQLTIAVPENITIWNWLFESKTSPLFRFPESDVKGFTNAKTKERVSFHDLKKYSTYISTALCRKYGLKEGQTVALFSPNTVWYPVAMFGALRVGGVITGASPAFNTEEMTFTLQKSKAKFLMTVPRSMEIAAAAAKNAGIPKENIFLLEGTMAGFRTIKDLVKIGQDLGEKDQVRAFEMPVGKKNRDLRGFLSFSSGTTGLPKAVCHLVLTTLQLLIGQVVISHQNVIAQCLQVQPTISSTHRRILAILPFFHITGLVHILHMPLVLNAEVYMLPSFSMESMLDVITSYRIEELLLVPPILILMVRDPIVDKYDLRFIKKFFSGAAPLSKEIIHQLEAKFPGSGCKQGYGMTESCSCITATTLEHQEWRYAHTVGTICASTEIKIIDEEGNELGIDQPGELLARGPQITMGYLDNEKATNETYLQDGFMRTGDQAMISAEGIVTITDRIKEMIKVNGIGVAPAELEDLLLGHRFVEDVAVLGIPDDYTGEVPKAFVVSKLGSLSQEELGKVLLDYVKKNKIRHKWLKEVEFIDAIPKSASGKILRRILRDHMKSGTGKGIIVKERAAQKSKL
jgi:4-coumarate--CoA ligase